MPCATNPPPRILGCDVGKAAIVVYDTATGQATTVSNTPPALDAFARRLGPDCLVVCEATGGYERALLDALTQAGCPAHRADARKVKAFIRSFGTLAKTDALDARALARYGQERHARLPRWQPPHPARQRLQTLVLTRADLVAQRTAWTNRLAAPGAEPVQDVLETLCHGIDDQIRRLDAAIAHLIRATLDLARAERVLRTIAGVGPKTAAALLALMPELGHLDRKQAAALAGLAPHPRQSGATDAARRTRGGRPEVKRVLFMAALSAARTRSPLKDTYERLCAKGTKPIVALTALMRRIIVIANARLRDEGICNSIS